MTTQGPKQPMVGVCELCEDEYLCATRPRICYQCAALLGRAAAAYDCPQPSITEGVAFAAHDSVSVPAGVLRREIAGMIDEAQMGIRSARKDKNKKVETFYDGEVFALIKLVRFMDAERAKRAAQTQNDKLTD